MTTPVPTPTQAADYVRAVLAEDVDMQSYYETAFEASALLQAMKPSVWRLGRYLGYHLGLDATGVGESLVNAQLAQLMPGSEN